MSVGLDRVAEVGEDLVDSLIGLDAHHTRLVGVVVGDQRSRLLLVHAQTTLDGLGMVGATAAAIAFFFGRAASNAFLVPPCLSVLRSRTP